MPSYKWTTGKRERIRQTGKEIGPGPGGGGGSTIDANMWFSFDQFPPSVIHQGDGFMCSVKVTSEHDTNQTIQLRVIVEGDQINSKHLLGGGELTIPANSSEILDIQIPPSELNLPEGSYDLGIYRSLDGLLDFQVSTPVTMVTGSATQPDDTNNTPDNTNEDQNDDSDGENNDNVDDPNDKEPTSANGMINKAITYAQNNPAKAAIGALGVAYVAKPKSSNSNYYPGTSQHGRNK